MEYIEATGILDEDGGESFLGTDVLGLATKEAASDGSEGLGTDTAVWGKCVGEIGVRRLLHVTDLSTFALVGFYVLQRDAAESWVIEERGGVDCSSV